MNLKKILSIFVVALMFAAFRPAFAQTTINGSTSTGTSNSTYTSPNGTTNSTSGTVNNGTNGTFDPTAGSVGESPLPPPSGSTSTSGTTGTSGTMSTGTSGSTGTTSGTVPQGGVRAGLGGTDTSAEYIAVLLMLILGAAGFVASTKLARRA